jgi:signal transduction histidine kinase
MTSEEMRRLKHDLLTPVNHIIGYSELMIETAMDRGQSGLADEIREIRKRGQRMPRLLGEMLSALQDQTAGGQSDAVRCDLRSVLEQIMDFSLSAQNAEELDLYAQDLGKIRRAAKELLNFLDKPQELFAVVTRSEQS